MKDDLSISISNISKKNLETMEKALDLFIRIGLGQVEAITTVIERDTSFGTLPLEAAEHLNLFKKAATGFSSNASYGIPNEHVRPVFKDAYAMIKVIGKQLATLNNDGPHSVRHDSKVLGLNTEPLITIREEVDSE